MTLVPIHLSQSQLASGIFGYNLPAAIVLIVSIVIGYLMVIVFGYTSDQKAIKVAKDQLKAHLLAVRLFQDQLGVVLRSYVGILRGTGRYLLLAFKPLLFVIIPLTFLMIQIDRYLGSKPLVPAQQFLVKARVADADGMNALSLQLPAELQTTAPPVHAVADNEVIWRLAAGKDGEYDVGVQSGGQTYIKKIVVGGGLERLSPIRLRGNFWQRMLYSAEPALPGSSPVQSIEVKYPLREVSFAGIASNWIIAFFVLSLVAGFIFKSALGIEI
jgi:hypothetical protein